MFGIMFELCHVETVIKVNKILMGNMFNRTPNCYRPVVLQKKILESVASFTCRLEIAMKGMKNLKFLDVYLPMCMKDKLYSCHLIEVYCNIPNVKL